MKLRYFFAFVMAFAIMIMLQSCDDEDDKDTPTSPKLPNFPRIESKDFDFKAVNLTVADRKLTATAGSVTITYKFDITINGETTSISYKSDELPVRPGDEVEIQFSPSCPEQTEALFSMPDGTTHKATSDDPTFNWTVPDNFTSGMQIQGNSIYARDKYIYDRTGIITLVEIK